MNGPYPPGDRLGPFTHFHMVYMMKKTRKFKKKTREIKGKRFSKRETKTFGSLRDIKSFMREHGRPDGKGGFVGGKSFDDRVDGLIKACETILQNENLPTDPDLTDGKTFFKTLEHYVTTERDFAHDSNEGLAARIILAANQMREGRNLPEAAFELGVLSTLLNIYSIESADGRKAARKERGRPWKNFAENLKRDFPDKLFPYVWRKIPINDMERHDEEYDFEGFKYYRVSDDGKERLLANPSKGEPYGIKKETFRTDYFCNPKSKKSSSKKQKTSPKIPTKK